VLHRYTVRSDRVTVGDCCTEERQSFGHAQAHTPHPPCPSGPPATISVHRLPVPREVIVLAVRCTSEEAPPTTNVQSRTPTASMTCICPARNSLFPYGSASSQPCVQLSIFDMAGGGLVGQAPKEI
jgi:hypothetical protein